MTNAPILVINSGSSSLKFGIYTEKEGDEQALVSGEAQGIGRAGGKLELRDGEGRVLRSEERQFTKEADAFNEAAEWLAARSVAQPAAIGHRIVHGGPRLTSHQAISPTVLNELERCVHFAPLHIPVALELIHTVERRYPKTPQFACFDTAFHTTMPEIAARFALPDKFYAEGLRRFGFHGLSYESILHQLGPTPPKRIVVAHLGSGASLAAIKDGQSVDTTMGLTPTGGIPMATRSGDLDPGVILYLQRAKRMDADSLERLLNYESGLTALSDGKSDMRELEAASERGDHRAQLTIDIFCMSVRKTIAAYSAVLDGMDLLVFTGGIGEHSARVRRGVCQGLRSLGITMDDVSNPQNQGTISTGESRVRVCVMATEEDRQIARHCRAMMNARVISRRPLIDGAVSNS